MGDLHRLPIGSLVTRHGCKHFVETGTGLGAGVGEAQKQPFTTLHTIEVEFWLYQKGEEFFAEHPDERLFRYLGQSASALQSILSNIPKEEPILFWMDAHFPGADFNLRAYGDEWRDAIRLPLESELVIIQAMRPEGRDVIICDDMMLYLDDDFEKGPLPEKLSLIVPKERNINFIHRLFRDTHDIKILKQDQGYALITPKTNKENNGTVT